MGVGLVGGRTGGGAGVGERGWGSMLMPVYGEISTLIQSLLPFSPGARRPVERLCLFSPGKLVSSAARPRCTSATEASSGGACDRSSVIVAVQSHTCIAMAVHQKKKGIWGLLQRKMSFIFQTKVSNFGRKLNSIVLAGGCQQISGALERLSDDCISPDWTQRRTFFFFFLTMSLLNFQK